ncbi:MAG: hypothetical protein OQJ99_06705, partial [Rhodospirillales bacterium]|nr:hypothetical protein [Rhodospirillales bacterium]MCW8970009.1 hypothetical protein [Rhodospirillales bacterium]MCW9003378.1 hypothetical protein [Rhodospirillales bacterium]
VDIGGRLEPFRTSQPGLTTDHTHCRVLFVRAVGGGFLSYLLANASRKFAKVEDGARMCEHGLSLKTR